MLTPVDKRLRRCARAEIPLFTPTNTGVAGLFNNSTGPHLLVVWDFAINGSANTPASGFYLFKGALSQFDANGVSVLVDEAAPDGQAQHDDLATIPTPVFDYNSGGLPSGNPFAFPLAILKSGWAFVMVCNTPNNPWGGTFYYEWFNPQKLVEWELP